MSMTQSGCEEYADSVIRQLIQHQPALFGSSPLNSEAAAQQVAKTVIALRRELIAQLQEKK
jgi:hypothetical protein